jgi:hypothetical protein
MGRKISVSLDFNGAYCLDSAWHHGWETIAALIAATNATTR